MPVNHIAELNLLSDAFLYIANQLSKLKELPKPQCARETVIFFDILEHVEYNILKIVSSLDDFKDEKTVGMRVHYIHKVGQALNEFGRSCEEFILWVDKHSNLSKALQILAPDAEEISVEFVDPDSLYTPKGDTAYTNLMEAIGASQEHLQATKSPDPKKFPTEKSVFETIGQFNQILLQISYSKQLIRKFASESLAVEDFFLD